ncbi:MAG: hypothetical protein ACI4MH_07610 [Candidatus Coproplasma sp.]
MKLKRDKQFKKYKTQIKTVDLLSDDGYADYGYNLVRDGAGFKRSIGAERETFFASCPSSPTSVYYSHATGGLFIATSNRLFLFDVRENRKYVLVSEMVTAPPFFCDMYMDGKCVTVAFNEVNRLTYDGYNTRSFESPTERDFYTGVMHGGRFFARENQEPLRISWTASHAFDWTEGINGCGYVYLAPEGGDVVKLVSFGDKLLAVRQFGITVIRAICEPQHFKVEPSATYLVADGIVADTCAVCAGKLFFATRSGIYAFDGSSITKVENPDEGRISEPVQAVACGDKYYMICTDAYLGKNYVFGYDATKKSGWFMGVSPSRLFVLEEYVFLVYGTGVYRCTETRNSRGYWRSKKLYFDTPSVKYLRRLYIEGDSDVNAYIESEGITRNFVGNGWQTINMYGDSFSFIFGTYDKLKRVLAEVEVRSGI